MTHPSDPLFNDDEFFSDPDITNDDPASRKGKPIDASSNSAAADEPESAASAPDDDPVAKKAAAKESAPSDPKSAPSDQEAAENIRFGDLGLSPEVLSAIEDLGFDQPTPIQAQAIPLLVEGTDLIGKAETGTGKTLAFMAPMLAQIDTERVATQGLVLCPTRELAQQVQEVAESLGSHLGVRTALLVGGVHQGSQIFRLREGAHVVVGTPGRVLEMLQEGYLNLGWVRHAVLDEADRMLDMGFIADVTSILKAVPTDRQVMLFSATVPPKLRTLMKSFMRNPKTVSTVSGQATVPQIRQRYVRVHPRDKEKYLVELLNQDRDATCIVFCNTRRAVKELDRTLWGMGYPAAAIHGDQEQEQRFQVLDAFKDRSVTTLVATDVAARGLDIESVGRVINYDVPDEVETYIHRIGRTGRAGGLGEAIMLVTRYDDRTFEGIQAIPKVVLEEIRWEGGGPPSRSRSHSGRDSRPSRPRGSGSRDAGRGSRSRADSTRRDGRSRDDRGRSQPSRDRQQPSRSQSSRPTAERAPDRARSGDARSTGTRPESPRRSSSERPDSRPRSRHESDRSSAADRESRRSEPRRSEPRRSEPRRSEPPSSKPRNTEPSRSRPGRSDRDRSDRDRSDRDRSGRTREGVRQDQGRDRPRNPRREGSSDRRPTRSSEGRDDRPRDRGDSDRSRSRSDRGEPRGQQDGRRRDERPSRSPGRSSQRNDGNRGRPPAQDHEGFHPSDYDPL